MRWRKLPYWVKGGVIAAGVLLVSGLLEMTCVHFASPKPSGGWECLPIALPWLPSVLFFSYLYTKDIFMPFAVEVFLGFLVNSGLGIGVGAFWGWVKATNKRNPQ